MFHINQKVTVFVGTVKVLQLFSVLFRVFLSSGKILLICVSHCQACVTLNRLVSLHTFQMQKTEASLLCLNQTKGFISVRERRVYFGFHTLRARNLTTFPSWKLIQLLEMPKCCSPQVQYQIKVSGPVYILKIITRLPAWRTGPVFFKWSVKICLFIHLYLIKNPLQETSSNMLESYRKRLFGCQVCDSMGCGTL